MSGRFLIEKKKVNTVLRRNHQNKINHLILVAIFVLSLVAAVFTGFGPANQSQAATANPMLATKKTDGWYWLNPSTSGYDLNDIDCVSNLYCMAVGEAGQLIRTTDFGTTWKNYPGVTGANLNAVDCPLPILCYAVGNNGTVLRYDGNLEKWFTLNSGTQAQLNDITCPGISQCRIVGTNGLMLYTVNAGTSWTDTSFSGLPTLNSVECPNTTVCYVVGDAGTIRRTTNGGTLWVPGTTTETGSLRGLSCPQVDTCFASAVDSGRYIKAGGNSSTWTSYYTGNLAVGETDISCVSPTLCAVSSEIGSVVRTNPDNSGAWLTVYDSNHQDYLNSITCAYNDNAVVVCLAVGNNGAIVRVAGTGSKKISQYTQDLEDITCINAVNCFAAGLFGTLLKTTSGGQLWEQVEAVNSTYHFRAVDCTGQGMCAAVGENGLAYYSSDKGVNWSQINYEFRYNLFDVDCDDGSDYENSSCTALEYDKVYDTISSTTFDSSGKVLEYKTTGGGLNALSCIDEAMCTGVGNGGLIRQATGGGGTYWNKVTSPTTVNLYDIDCLDLYSCYAVGANGTWLQYQYPSTWKVNNVNKNVTLKSITCASAGNCKMLAATGEVFEISNNTLTGNVKNTAAAAINHTSLVCPRQCLVAGSGGSILGDAFLAFYHQENGAGNWPGTLSYINSLIPDGYEATAYLGNTTTKFIANAPTGLTFKGLNVIGKCGAQGPAFTIDLNNNPGITLNGNSSLTGVKVINSTTTGIKVKAADAPNSMKCVKVLQ